MCLMIALPVVGFYLGEKYGEKKGFIYWAESRLSLKGDEDKETDFYADISKWVIHPMDDIGIEVRYPLDLEEEDLSRTAPASDWRLDSQGILGQKILKVRIPKIFDRQTNFSGAELTIGYSADKKAIKDCITAPQNGSVTEKEINGRIYSVFSSSDAGAGNYYDTKSYRSVVNGKCYAIEHTIHSVNIKNYPNSYDLRLVHKDRVTKLLDDMVGTLIVK